MIVVSDTTAITSLIAIGRADLLRQIFGEVLIPSAVLRELTVVHPEVPEFVRVREVTDGDAVRRLAAVLDTGEAEAIVLAEELAADFFADRRSGWTRDRDAARLADHRSRRRSGAGKARRNIPMIAPILEALVTVGEFWVSAQIRNRALADAGEPTL